jgi:hypothetical protein
MVDSINHENELSPQPRESYRFPVGQGIVILDLPAGLSATAIGGERIQAATRIVTDAYLRYSDGLGVQPAGTVIFKRRSLLGIDPTASNISTIGTASDLIPPLDSHPSILDIAMKNLPHAAIEIGHHVHWLEVARKGEFDHARTKVGMAISETLTGHPLMRQPFEIDITTPPSSSS